MTLLTFEWTKRPILQPYLHGCLHMYGISLSYEIHKTSHYILVAFILTGLLCAQGNVWDCFSHVK